MPYTATDSAILHSFCRLCLLPVKLACKCDFFADIPESPNFVPSTLSMCYSAGMSEENKVLRLEQLEHRYELLETKVEADI